MTDKLRQSAEAALKALKNKTTVYVRFDDGVVEATEILEDALMERLAEPDTDANCDRTVTEHWLTKELFAEYLELIYHAITNMEDRSALLHKARWMKEKGKV